MKLRRDGKQFINVQKTQYGFRVWWKVWNNNEVTKMLTMIVLSNINHCSSYKYTIIVNKMNEQFLHFLLTSH